MTSWLGSELYSACSNCEPKHNMLYRLFSIIMFGAPFGLAICLPRHGKAVSASVVMGNMFGSQPGRAALRYEKRAKEEASLKKKEATETAKKAEDDKTKVAEGVPNEWPVHVDGLVVYKLVLTNVLPYLNTSFRLDFVVYKYVRELRSGSSSFEWRYRGVG